MVLPLVPAALIAVGAVTGAGGVGLLTKGGYEIKKANTRIKRATDRYGVERRRLEAREAATNDRLQSLGARQEQAFHDVVERMADFLRRHEKLVSESEKLLVDGLDPVGGEVTLGRGLGQDPIAWMRGVVGSAVTGVGINAGLTTAATTWAAASTGTAISTLSGAAATNATLAFLGGGSIASGGGGMVVGAAALNVVTIGPALLVSGFVVAGQGEKAKTKALEGEAAVNVAIAEMRVTKVRFDAIIERAKELDVLLDKLTQRALSTLDTLESERFDPDLPDHAVRFQQALTMTVAVLDVASTEVVDASGELNEESASLKLRYRALIKEPNDD